MGIRSQNANRIAGRMSRSVSMDRPERPDADDFALNARVDAAVLIAMKAILSTALICLLIGACTSPGRPPHNTGAPLRSSSGNAELHGTSADEVIWRSTQQWHSDRWLERRHRR
ncbi:MAG: hypothetical protein ACNA8L_07680 [Luteolibacter sp.]|jgi:hypothetical protein